MDNSHPASTGVWQERDVGMVERNWLDSRSKASGVQGSGFWGSGFRVCSFRLRLQSSGFGASDLGAWVECVGFMVECFMFMVEG